MKPRGNFLGLWCGQLNKICLDRRGFPGTVEWTRLDWNGFLRAGAWGVMRSNLTNIFLLFRTKRFLEYFSLGGGMVVFLQSCRGFLVLVGEGSCGPMESVVYGYWDWLAGLDLFSAFPSCPFIPSALSSLYLTLCSSWPSPIS